jgi:hypothetical protein
VLSNAKHASGARKESFRRQNGDARRPADSANELAAVPGSAVMQVRRDGCQAARRHPNKAALHALQCGAPGVSTKVTMGMPNLSACRMKRSALR